MMLRNFHIKILLIVVLLTSASFTVAQNDLWDEKGAWISEPETDIFNEAEASFEIGWLKSEYISTGYDYYNPSGDSLLVKNTTDVLAIAGNFKHYFQPRYQNPEVPYLFIPYNYKQSSFEISLARTESTFKREITPLSHSKQAIASSDSKSTINTFDIKGTYYADQSGGFIGGEVTHLESISTDFFFVGGYYNSRVCAGLQLGLLSHENTNDSYEVSPRIEFFPWPQISLSLKPAYHRTDGDYASWSYYVPLEVKYIIIPAWVEFDCALQFSNSSSKNKYYFLDMQVSKYIKDNRLYVAFGDKDFRRNGETLQTVRNLDGGIDLVFQRKFILYTSINYNWNDYRLSDADYDGFIFGLGLSALI